MYRYYWKFIIILVMASIILTACSPEKGAVTVSPSPTQTSGVEPTDTREVPTQVNAESVAQVEDVTPTTVQEVEEAPSPEPVSNTCIDCHQDKQALIDSAKVEEEVISENEGQG